MHRVTIIALCLGFALLAGCEPEANFVQKGEASFYSSKLEGRPTASGEPYDAKKLTAAHRHLPLGTTATVIHNDTGRSVTVRINDRGPFAKKRIIDLSLAAWRALGVPEASGITQVTVKATLDPEKAEALRSQAPGVR